MATSGSIDFSLTAREAITYALGKLRVLPSGGTPTAAQAAQAMRELNLMLKGWQKHTSLWRMTEGAAPLIANTASYALSPVPYRVISARFDDQSTETPLTEMSRQEYYDLPLKTNTGIPTSYYVDRQRATVTMYVWPLMASVTDETINYTFQRKFEDIDSLDNDIDVRQEHLEVVAFNLAGRLADDFGRSGDIVNRIIARAEVLLDAILDDDREDEIRFVPDMTGMHW